jgi:hypothetical protein
LLLWSDIVNVEEFHKTCELSHMHEHTFTLSSRFPTENVIPSSELAIHVRAADKTPQLIFLSGDDRYAFVLTTDGQFVEGLTSEVVPWSARLGYVDQTDELRCSGCGRWVPCRHCPEGTPTVAQEKALSNA